jgi:predicted porin
MLISRSKAKSCRLVAGFATAAVLVGASAASAGDMDTMVTKAPPAPAFTPPAACGSLYDFFVTACPLTWNGVTFYGTVDIGGSYMTHGAPFDRNFPTGVPYVIGGGGTGATGRQSGLFLAPNAMSQSNAGFKVKEAIGGDWSFVGQAGVAFDPYSLLLSNAPQAMQNAIGVPENQQESPIDSSRWGWLADQIYAGVSSGTYGTLTFGRQNTLLNDAIVAYDPMGAAYGFSLIGFSGKTAGAGDTEDARWTTAIKYRVNIGDFRLAVMGQPGFDYAAYNPNQGAVAGGIGGDIRHFGPGILSLDVFGTWEKDAVNIGTAYPGSPTQFNSAGFPNGLFPANTFLKATISNQTSVMVVAKYSFGTWGNTPPPVVGKAPPAPSGPTGIPLTLYAGYEWIQFTNPSDPQTSFLDDGFLFASTAALTAAWHGQSASANGTAINNNAFNVNCASTGGSGGTGCSNEIFQVIWTGAKYGITKDLDVIGAYYHYIQNQYISNLTAAGAPVCAVATAHGQCGGWFDTYSMVLDWRFLPKWDTYVGFMYSAAYGGIANSDISTNNLAVTGGVRFRF